MSKAGVKMVLDAAFFDSLSKLRLSMGQKSAMNLLGNRKSVQKGSSAEFSAFREYMPGDDPRRIDWNAYGRLDRLYIKEYTEEKEAVVSVLLDTSASMVYGEKKKSDLAVMLAAAVAYMGVNNMDRVILYDMKRMDKPFAAGGGKDVFPRMADYLSSCSFEGTVDIEAAVRRMPGKGTGVTILISDFLQESFLENSEKLPMILRFLNYRKQKAVLLQVLAKEELSVKLTGTKNLIDMETEERLRVTLDASGIRLYEKALEKFCNDLKRACVGKDAVYVLCSTGREFKQLLFEELRILYDI